MFYVFYLRFITKMGLVSCTSRLRDSAPLYSGDAQKTALEASMARLEAL